MVDAQIAEDAHDMHFGDDADFGDTVFEHDVLRDRFVPNLLDRFVPNLLGVR